jgi:hypothetical protein
MSRRQSNIVLDAVRRFPNLPSRTLARHLLAEHGELFENDLEKIRTKIRYYRGSHGNQHRQNAQKHAELFTKTPVVLPPTWRKIRTPYQMPPGVWLILNDPHIPFHEPKPLEAAVQMGQAEKVDGVFLNGDMWDCAAVSYWPMAHRDMNRELEIFNDFLDWLRQEFPKQKIVYKPGNHEYRLPRYFIAKAPELAETPWAAMETVMGFEERGIEFLDYFQLVKFGKLPVFHGHEIPNLQRTVNPARGLFLRAKTFAACGHCHSTSEHSETNINDELLTTWSFGCLCDLHPDWMPYGNRWNWGAGLISVEKNGNFEVINRRILPNGKMV